MLKYRILLQHQDGKRRVLALTDYDDLAFVIRDAVSQAYDFHENERVDIEDCSEHHNLRRELHIARRPSEQMTAKEVEACAET